MPDAMAEQDVGMVESTMLDPTVDDLEASLADEDLDATIARELGEVPDDESEESDGEEVQGEDSEEVVEPEPAQEEAPRLFAGKYKTADALYDAVVGLEERVYGKHYSEPNASPEVLEGAYLSLQRLYHAGVRTDGQQQTRQETPQQTQEQPVDPIYEDAVAKFTSAAQMVIEAKADALGISFEEARDAFNANEATRARLWSQCVADARRDDERFNKRIAPLRQEVLPVAAEREVSAALAQVNGDGWAYEPITAAEVMEVARLSLSPEQMMQPGVMAEVTRSPHLKTFIIGLRAQQGRLQPAKSAEPEKPKVTTPQPTTSGKTATTGTKTNSLAGLSGRQMADYRAMTQGVGGYAISHDAALRIVKGDK